MFTSAVEVFFLGRAEVECIQQGKWKSIAPTHRSETVKPIRVVVVGGGLAAVQFAKTHRRKVSREPPSQRGQKL